MKNHSFLNLALVVLLLTVFGCKKDSDNEPSRTDVLTSKSWQLKDLTMRVNGTSGAYTVPANDQITYHFTADGKGYTEEPDGTRENIAWSWLSNETVLRIGSASDTYDYQVYTLTKSNLAMGFQLNQEQIKQDLNSGGGTVLYFALLYPAFSFPANTPKITETSKLTDLQLQINYQAR